MTTGKRASAGLFLAIVAGAFIAAYLHTLLLPGVFTTWDRQSTDQLFVLRDRWQGFLPPLDPRVAHLDLNNSTVATLDQFYLDRSHFARVIQNLGTMDVAAQMWDFIFAARDTPAHDQAIIAATAAAGNVYFGMALTLSPSTMGPDGATPAPPATAGAVWHPPVDGGEGSLLAGVNPLPTFQELSRAARGIGSLSVTFDRDGVLRRVPLLVRYGGGVVPILPLRVACDLLKVPPERIVVRPGDSITLTGALTPGSLSPMDIRIPIDRRGNMIVNYAGPWGRMPHYNMADILTASADRDLLEMWGEELRGKILVISDITTGAADLGTVPGDAAYPLSGVHANIINSILTGRFLREISAVGMIAIEAALMLAVWMLSLRCSSVAFGIGSILMSLGYIAFAVGVFLHIGLIVSIVRPLQMMMFSVGGILMARYVSEEREKIESLRERDHIRATFGRYLSNEVVEELLAAPEGYQTGGESRVVTFLVADLRGFTAMTAALVPETVIDILNRFLAAMVPIIARHRGTVDEILGDGLLVFFGAPIPRDNDARRAIVCAVEMQNALDGLNAAQRHNGLPALEMGIGIHTGTVVVGTIGSQTRAKYGAVGSAINTAFRIESHSVGGQVLISEATRTAVGDAVIIRERMQARFKGLDGVTTIYDIAGVSEAAGPVLAPTKPQVLTPLTEARSVRCFVICDKEIDETPLPGQVIAAGNDVIDLRLDAAVPLLTDLKILFDEPAEGASGERYGKVTDEIRETGALRVTLTGRFFR
ncbi:MAG: adenylate/guanylate cyclase domain-containing protein [Pseudomonadota bacterium]